MPQMNIAKLFAEYKKPLVSFVRKRLTNDDYAEDILQDIFYQFIRKSSTAGIVIMMLTMTQTFLFAVVSAPTPLCGGEVH
jgi:DNA-directed RNA polymerase specialized sigma24 family protein